MSRISAKLLARLTVESMRKECSLATIRAERRRLRIFCRWHRIVLRVANCGCCQKNVPWIAIVFNLPQPQPYFERFKIAQINFLQASITESQRVCTSKKQISHSKHVQRMWQRSFPKQDCANNFWTATRHFHLAGTKFHCSDQNATPWKVIHLLLVAYCHY